MNMEKYYIDIGKNVKELRKEKGITQKELAILMGLKSRSFIANAEIGKDKHFGIEHIIKLCDVFECRISRIVNIREDEQMPMEWLDDPKYHETE